MIAAGVAVPATGDRVGGRYRIGRSLGAGGMGIVFAGVDGVLGRRVAIKLISPAIAGRRAAVARLRQEARVMARLQHPAAVQLYDHGTDGRFGPFLVMEQLDGEDLAARLRRKGALPLGVALAVVEQLCDIVAAAHDAGVLHHDLKPANVFVLRDGAGAMPRVKLLDFGAATATFGAARRRAGEDGRNLRGTLAYMAPERWAPRTARVQGAMADVYGLGALLYEMLAGRAPFSAPTRAALRTAVLHDRPPPLPTSGRGDVPRAVAAVIEQALDKRPDCRPTDARAFARALGLRIGQPAGPETAALSPAVERADEPLARAPSRAGGKVFVGRRDALASLMTAVAAAARGRPGLVWIEGPSGIGKSALLEEARWRLDQRRDVLALSSRARERASVPFPTLDEAMGELATYLGRLPSEESAGLLPRGAGPLGRLFPTLARLPAVARASAEPGASADPAEEGRRAREAFRGLVRRVGERQPVILLLDDVQWLDADSARLLELTIAGPDPPMLLLVGATRSDPEPEHLQQRRRLEAVLPGDAVTRIALGALSEEEALEMARSRWVGGAPLAAQQARRLARLSGGVPFFMEMLVRDPGDPTPDATSIEGVLRARRRALPAPARGALELLCVASRPLRWTTLLAALAVPPDGRALEPLLAGALARFVRLDGELALEPYHDRIRESIRAALPAATRRAHHRRLAACLRNGPEPDIAAIIEHLAGGGETGAAADLARTAAQSASEQLAFDRAAALLEVALTHGRAGRAAQVTLLREQARALENAGRRREAGGVLLRTAALLRDKVVVAALQREAGAHLLSCGDVPKALEVILPALHAAGLRLPIDLPDIVASTGAALQALGERGLAPVRSPVPAALATVDLLLELALGLAHVDLRALPFACQALRAALDAGEPRRLQRACALFVINTVEYVPTPLVGPVLALCRTLTDANADPSARALLDAAVAEEAHFAGDFLTAEAAFERAERTLLESGARASRELATVRDLAVFLQYAQKGDFRTQLERTQRWLAQAEAAQDVFHAGMLRVAHAIVWIAQGDTAKARAELRRAQAESIGTAGVLEVAVSLYFDIIDRYEGDDVALASSGDARSALLRSPAAQTPFLSGYLGLHAAWRMLRAWGGGHAGPEVASGVTEIVARLRASGMGIWSAVASALEGNCAFLQGRREAALGALEQAEQTFRRLHMLCLAACARKRRGQLIAGELGARLEGEADAELWALGVADVERWAAAYWSMFDARAVAERTQPGDDA